MSNKNPLKTPTYILNVLYEDEDNIWISKRSNTLKVMSGLWQTVCGKVEANESSINVYIKETIEKTGIDIDPKRPKFLFNDEIFNCNVYLTKTNPSEVLKWTEPAKMSKWKTINKEQYKKLSLAKLMTDTHNEEHQ